jgi:hypothetical protein
MFPLVIVLGNSLGEMSRFQFRLHVQSCSRVTRGQLARTDEQSLRLAVLSMQDATPFSKM